MDRRGFLKGLLATVATAAAPIPFVGEALRPLRTIATFRGIPIRIVDDINELLLRDNEFLGEMAQPYLGTVIRASIPANAWRNLSGP